jgi:hypothetical protein
MTATATATTTKVEGNIWLIGHGWQQQERMAGVHGSPRLNQNADFFTADFGCATKIFDGVQLMDM